MIVIYLADDMDDGLEFCVDEENIGTIGSATNICWVKSVGECVDVGQ